MIQYERDIISILITAGNNGLSVAKIARHVHNLNSSLFESKDYEETHQQVSQYIRKHSRNSYDTIMRTEKRGVYKLNPNSTFLRQLQIDFNKEANDTTNEENSEKHELPLGL